MLDEEGGTKQAKNKKAGYKLTEEQKEDPYNFLGFGMVAYRDLMFTMILLFSFMSVLMLPAMMYYKKGGAITNAKGFGAFSLGNMGYSSA